MLAGCRTGQTMLTLSAISSLTSSPINILAKCLLGGKTGCLSSTLAGSSRFLGLLSCLLVHLNEEVVTRRLIYSISKVA